MTAIPARPATLVAGTVPTIVPVLERPHVRVLDLGCGANRTLCELDLAAPALRVGLDLDAALLRRARDQHAMVRYAAGDAHHLPFASGSFDLVISKVALPYTHIPRVLREIFRILDHDGRLWITLHPLRMAAAALAQELRAGRLGNAAYRGYVIVNGLLLELFGAEFRCPLARSRIESFQSVRGIARALSRAGFTDVRFELRSRGTGYEMDDRRYGPVFAVAARK
jgi:ubiquinone/menaquinone biosynthesis C-methylase UbiE